MQDSLVFGENTICFRQGRLEEYDSHRIYIITAYYAEYLIPRTISAEVLFCAQSVDWRCQGLGDEVG